MMFHTYNNLKKCLSNNPRLQIRNQNITSVNNTNLLGVIIDNKIDKENIKESLLHICLPIPHILY